MPTDLFDDLIQRCHQRHQKSLRQQKTMATPAMLSTTHPHQYTVYCAHKFPVLLDDLEQADISFMPIGRAPEHDSGPKSLMPKRFLKRQGMRDWHARRWDVSWGLQIYTGLPSQCNGARWHDLDFKYDAISAAPDAVLASIDVLVNAVANPLLTLSRSGGLRFSCRVPEYLHPNTEEERLYVYKHTPTLENPNHRDIYLEILGEKGYSRWDARYEILLGNLLDPPVISKEVLFAPIDALRAKLHEPVPQKIEQNETFTDTPSSLGSHNLDLAKEALSKRGFSYVRQADGFHHWIRYGGDANNTDALLWENEETVWIRTSTPNAELPTEATPITEIWYDTGIVPPTLAITPPISDKMLAVREGKLSPLAIRRPRPVLGKPETQDMDDQTLEETTTRIRSILNGTARILGLNVESDGRHYSDIESHLLNTGATCLNAPSLRSAEAAEQRLQEQGVLSVARWKPRMHLWEQVKEIPVDVRMANPFQHGNVCEDPERCDALEETGGDPNESICPQCPAYEACQERGYLSQHAALQRAKTQIVGFPQLFFDPQHAKLADVLLKPVDRGENRRCIINGVTGVYPLFLRCRLSKKVLEAWIVNWRGSALGNFATTLLNALEIRGKTHGDAVKRVRAAMQTFEWQEAEIIQQMTQVNVPGKVVEKGKIDSETGQELARFTIEFENGTSAYIPLNNDVRDTLKAKGLPVFPLCAFTLNEYIKIPMPMAEAIRFGILNPETIESIQAFPKVYPDPTWTFWHQLKHLFAHYTRDVDVPIRWDHKVLTFTVPPILHSSVRRLVLISETLSEQHLRRTFPDDEVEVHRIEPTPWLPSNQVFQIRTGLYTRDEILDYNRDSIVGGVSKIGQRFFVGIRAEIEKELNIVHVVVANRLVLRRLMRIIETENVCFVTYSGEKMGGIADSEEAEVIWIVGVPERAIGDMWEHSQVLFGNDENPLCYDREMKPFCHKDERIQSVYEADVVSLLTRTVGLAQLSRLSDKRIVLMTSMPLPDITDRPETLLFDWEDFEIAGSLDKLPEVIATRQHFEVEKANLTAESGRDKVQHILGCTQIHANRVLRKLRGTERVTFREQILTLLASGGEKKAAEMIAVIDGHPKAIRHTFTKLVNTGEIVKVRWGVYALPKK